MKIQTALLPHKHVRFAGSLIGMAGYVRQFINTPISIDGLWAAIDATDDKIFKINFTQFIYSLDILFFLGVIFIDENGMILKKEKN